MANPNIATEQLLELLLTLKVGEMLIKTNSVQYTYFPKLFPQPA